MSGRAEDTLTARKTAANSAIRHKSSRSAGSLCVYVTVFWGQHCPVPETMMMLDADDEHGR